MPIVRAADSGDAEAIGRLKVDSWRDVYAPLVAPDVLAPYLDAPAQATWLAGLLADGGLVLVAEAPELVGFVACSPAATPEPYLEALHVAPGRRGRGTGTLLMRRLAAELRARRRGSLALDVLDGNEGAERFYRRLGGLDAGARPAPWTRGTAGARRYRWPDPGALDRLARRGPGEQVAERVDGV